jgi:hypothetical protein
VAVHFAWEGADLAILYLSNEHQDAQETAALVEREGRKCLKFAGDVSKPEVSLAQAGRGTSTGGGVSEPGRRRLCGATGAVGLRGPVCHCDCLSIIGRALLMKLSVFLDNCSCVSDEMVRAVIALSVVTLARVDCAATQTF